MQGLAGLVGALQLFDRVVEALSCMRLACHGMQILLLVGGRWQQSK